MKDKIMKWLAMALAVYAGKEAAINPANAAEGNTPTTPKKPGMEQGDKNSLIVALDKMEAAKTEFTVNFADNFPSAKAPVQEFVNLTNIDDTFFLPLSNSLVLDPAFATDRESITVLGNLYASLVHFDSKNNPVLDAAESYEVSEDGKTWIFKLREGAKWSDGEDVTAYDFVYAWRRLMDPNIKAPNRYILMQANVLNAHGVSTGAVDPEQLGVAALSDYELMVVLDKPTPWLLSLLAAPATVALREVSEDNQIISNGAYRFAPDENNDFLLVKNEHYWDADNVQIEKIRAYGDKNGAEASVGFAELNRNIIYLNKNNEESLSKLFANQIVTRIYPEAKFIEFNLRDRVMNKPNVRKAINLLVDRKRFADSLEVGSIPTTVFAPPVVAEAANIPQKAELLAASPENIENALALLKKSGYSKRNQLVLRYIYPLETHDETSFVMHKEITDMLVENSQGVIRIEYVGLSQKDYFQALRQGNFQLTTIGWTSDYNHVSSFYNILANDNGDNFAGYQSFKYNYLLEQANNTTDEEKRRELYLQANMQLEKDLPIIPLVWTADRIITDPRLKNFASNSYEVLVKNLYIDKSVTTDTMATASVKKPEVNVGKTNAFVFQTNAKFETEVPYNKAVAKNNSRLGNKSNNQTK